MKQNVAISSGEQKIALLFFIESFEFNVIFDEKCVV